VAPLHLTTNTICPAIEALGNVRKALDLPHPYFKCGEPKDRPISICGSGPSLKHTIGDLVGDVMACNTSVVWLHDNGVKPDMAMFWDADPRVKQFARRITGTTYYVASRCDPIVFNQLEGMNVVIWHAAGDAGLMDRLEEWVDSPHQFSPTVNGGSAAVTRAAYLACALGYRDLHFFGVDSSFEGDVKTDTHVRPSVVPEEEINVLADGRWFQTTPWLAAQAQEFETVWRQLTQLGASITVHGDGLIPHIWRTLKTETV
jgi:hypothetical protein